MNFRFLNIPVYIHPTFWIFLILFTGLFQDFSIQSVIWGLVLFFSLLVHEYGHAATAAYFGGNPIITFEAFGGNARYNPVGMTLKQQFLITLNGPLLESALILVSWALLKSGFVQHPYIVYFLQAMMILNTWWVLLNLIPIAPLDGGHLLRYLLQMKFGDKGVKASLQIGLCAAILAAPFLFYYKFFFFGALMLIFGYQNYQILKHLHLPSRPSREENPFSAYMEGVQALNGSDVERGKEILQKLLKSKDSKMKHLAIESLAKVYYIEEDKQKSYELLLQADPELLQEGKPLLCKLAFEHQNFHLIGKYSKEIYAKEPTFDIAVLNSKAFAHLDQPKHAGAWLEAAARFGDEYRVKAKELLMDPLYDLVREHEEFKPYAEQIGVI